MKGTGYIDRGDRNRKERKSNKARVDRDRIVKNREDRD